MAVGDDRAGVPEHEEKGGGRRRVWIVAVILAVVLLVVAAIVLTSALRGEPESAPSVTRSPSPTPTPTPTPTVVAPPAEGVRAFGGECSAALTDEEVTTVVGRGMFLSEWPWESGEAAVVGGLDCVWITTDEYLGTVVRVYAYPASILPLPDPEVAPFCEDVNEPGMSFRRCRAAGAINSTWLYLEVTTHRTISPSQATMLWDLVEQRVAQHPPAVAASRNDAWWDLPDCAELADGIDARALGYGAVSSEPSGRAEPGDPHSDPVRIPEYAGATDYCVFRFDRGNDAPEDDVIVSARIVPGGEFAYRSAAAYEHAFPVSVAGAAGAVDTSGNDRFEASDARLVVTDGTNGLLLGISTGERWPEEYLPLAAGVLAALQAMN